jgi:hypothetical protein
MPAVVKASDPAKARKRAEAAEPADSGDTSAAAASCGIRKIATSDGDDRTPVGTTRRPASSRYGKIAADEPPERPPPAGLKQSAIVTIRSPKGAMLAHLLEDLTPEEHRRRGDAADALFRTVVRRATGKNRS